MKVRFGSVCSGIEAASVAWQTGLSAVCPKRSHQAIRFRSTLTPRHTCGRCYRRDKGNEKAILVYSAGD
jgi:hypothetical protein